MNARRFLLAATFAGGLFSTAALPARVIVTPPATEPVFTAPSPAMVVAPVNIPRHYQNETVRLSLSIDKEGRPSYVDLLDGRDPALVRHLLPAIAQWQFKPATRNGEPVAVEVVLPLTLVESTDS